jgi:catechol 2,3-dioxygenase-like lactoylglutathione lyase family enzyme
MKRFNGICIISEDVDRLGKFYQDLFQVAVVREGDNLAFATEGAEFTIFSAQGMERMAPGSMKGAGCGSFTVEIEVEDVDAEYVCMTRKGVPCVKLPETYPWGRRSAWFRDPDGNIINLYMRA